MVEPASGPGLEHLCADEAEGNVSRSTGRTEQIREPEASHGAQQCGTVFAAKRALDAELVGAGDEALAVQHALDRLDGLGGRFERLASVWLSTTPFSRKVCRRRWVSQTLSSSSRL